MTPFEQAAAVYEREPCARTFAADLFLHLRNGYVISSPSFFVMLRPVDSTAADSLIVDPANVFPVERCDAWLIYLMAGDMAEAWRHFPFRLPKIGFERKNRLRYYGFQFLQERIARSSERGQRKQTLQGDTSCETSAPSTVIIPPTCSGRSTD